MRKPADGPIVILGAGLAGLSLGCALVDEIPGREIVLIDRRHTWPRDRTWCTWQIEPQRFDACVTHRWPTWQLRHGDRLVTGESRRHPYVHIDAALVYEQALGVLDSAGVEIRTGEVILDITGGDPPVITTSAGSFSADTVFDAMGVDSPLLGSEPVLAADFSQRFLGWEIEIDRPAFDPAVATLMDFREHDRPGVSFLYTLPFSPHRALIEHTSIEPAIRADRDREAPLREHLAGLGIDGWTLHRTERGQLPMARQHVVVRRNRVHMIGTGAGAVRPSSGYAFSRIQRHCTEIARALAAGRPFPERLSKARYSRLDEIFLKALSRSREPESLFLSAASVTGDVFARFMADASSVADDLRLAAKLPKVELATAAVSAAGSRSA